jgi:NitT/TauT family transport system substrate-binding protein
MSMVQNRRHFLTFISLATAAGLTELSRSVARAEPPPEITTIRLPASPGACLAPIYLAKELLHLEGFTEVRYVPSPLGPAGATMLFDGVVDFDMYSWGDYLPAADAGKPVMVLSGINTGCMELRANDSIRSVSDLRGKRVGVSGLGVTDHMLVSLIAAYVGLRPASDISWVVNPSISQVDLFNAGKVDAFIGSPPDPGQPCMHNIGHVIVNIAHDRPWSDYFCCMAVANADFVRNNPVATKRALRAILKATDLCHQQPERVAQRMADLGFSYECALMTLKDARYGLWREYDPEDTVRFFSLRLNEIGMIKKTPEEVISGYTDWRFLKEIKRELKT